MHGTELKAIREELEMSQAEFAIALGMSRVAIGLMERGRKIERRTALAALALRGAIERVSVAPFGNQFVGMVTEAHPTLPGRLHRILSPSYRTKGEAVEAAMLYAETNSIRYDRSGMDRGV